MWETLNGSGQGTSAASNELNSWTWRVTWIPYNQKLRQETLVKRWRDDLDKYWSATKWQRTPQDWLLETACWFIRQPRDTRAAQWKVPSLRGNLPVPFGGLVQQGNNLIVHFYGKGMTFFTVILHTKKSFEDRDPSWRSSVVNLVAILNCGVCRT